MNGLAIYSSMKKWSRCAGYWKTRASLFIFIYCISGCVTYIRHGVDSTDFSDVYYGMPRSEFENIVGRLVVQRNVEDNVLVIYEYDRGYIGCVASGRCKEASPAAEAGAQAIDLMFAAGMAGALRWHEIKECQIGFLRAKYGLNEKLIEIQLLPPEPYKAGTYLWEKDIRKPWLNNPCREVYYHPREITIPDTVLTDSVCSEVP